MFRIFRRMRAEYKEEEEIIGKSGDYLRWRKSIWYDEQKNKDPKNKKINFKND